MIDFKTELIAKLESKLPELKDKIQTGAVDADTKPPYAAYTTPEEVAMRTIHGIAGYSTSFDIAVFHPKFSEVERLKGAVVAILDNTWLAGRKCQVKSVAQSFDAEYEVHGYTLTFKIV